MTEPLDFTRPLELVCDGTEVVVSSRNIRGVRLWQTTAMHHGYIDDYGRAASDPTGPQIVRDRVEEAPAPLDDSSLRARIGEIGNQIHNLGCEHQNNEALSDRLADLRGQLWALAKIAPTTPTAPEPDGEVESLLHEAAVCIDQLERTVSVCVPVKARPDTSGARDLLARLLGRTPPPAPDRHPSAAPRAGVQAMSGEAVTVTQAEVQDIWRDAYIAVYGCEPTHPTGMYENAYKVIREAFANLRSAPTAGDDLVERLQTRMASAGWEEVEPGRSVPKIKLDPLCQQAATRIQSDAATIAGLAQENIALRSLLGGGCDANNEGPHSTLVGKGNERFCADCGEMVDAKGRSKPWFNEGRIGRVKDRLARAALTDTPAKEEGHE